MAPWKYFKKPLRVDMMWGCFKYWRIREKKNNNVGSRMKKRERKGKKGFGKI